MKMKQRENVTPMVRNKFGVRVKKCCLSCAFKEVVSMPSKRYCMKLKEHVKPPSRMLCPYWQMGEQQRMSGLSHGRVKYKEYLMYVLEERLEEERLEEERLEEDPEQEPVPVEDIRQKFEEAYGSVYEEF